MLGSTPSSSSSSRGLAKSKGEVRRNTGGHYVNQVSLADRGDRVLDDSDLLGAADPAARGKGSFHLVTLT